MAIYVVLERYHMSLCEISTNLNNFDFILHILLHVIIRVTKIQKINDLRSNVHFDICNNNKTPSCVKPHISQKCV